MASARGHRFQALAQLVDFHGQAGESQRLSSMEAVLLDQRTQLGVTVQGRPPQAKASSNRGERDALACSSQVKANLLDLLDQIGFSHDA